MKQVYIAKEYGVWYYRKTGRKNEVELYNYKMNLVGIYKSVLDLRRTIKNSAMFF